MDQRILVVDDEEGIRLLYKEEISELGCCVDVAASGEEALEMIPDGNYELVLLDIKMTGMDGVEVLRRIKEKYNDLPVILSTAYPHYKHEFGTWACDAYVVKSSDLTELKEAIKTVLAKKEK